MYRYRCVIHAYYRLITEHARTNSVRAHTTNAAQVTYDRHIDAGNPDHARTSALHTYTHTYSHTYGPCRHGRTHTHTHARTYVRTHSLTHTHAHTRTHTHTHARTYAHTHTHTHTQARKTWTVKNKINHRASPTDYPGSDDGVDKVEAGHSDGTSLFVRLIIFDLRQMMQVALGRFGGVRKMLKYEGYALSM